MWNPISNTLQSELTSFPVDEPIESVFFLLLFFFFKQHNSFFSASNRKVVFIPNTTFLVTSSQTHICVWDLLRCSIIWTYSAFKVKDILPDVEKGRFMVLSNLHKDGFSNICVTHDSHPVSVFFQEKENKEELFCLIFRLPNLFIFGKWQIQ